MDASTGGRTSQTRSWFCKHQHDLAAWHALIESEMLRLPACVENAQRKGRGLPGRHVLHQNSEIDFVQHKVLLHNGPPKSFFQDEECESCNEMLQHQILALYLSKMLLSRLLIDSGNTWQSSDWPDAASSPPCSSSSKDINVSSTSISAWSFVSVLATTKTPPKVPGLMLLQNHLHTWDLKCIVLSTIKVLVCNHVKPLFIVHCHLSAAAMHRYAEFDHETSRWSKARFFLVRWNNAGESSPFGKKLTFDHWASVGLDVASEACELIVTEELLGRPAYGDDVHVDSASTAVDVESRKKITQECKKRRYYHSKYSIQMLKNLYIYI